MAATLARRYSRRNSAALIPVFSALLCNARMPAIADIRHTNLMLLIKQYGGQKPLSDKIEKSPAQISQWVNRSPDAKTGKPRSLGTESARDIEGKLGLPLGWMDTLQSEPAHNLPTWSSTETGTEAHSAESRRETAGDYVRFRQYEGAGGMGDGVVNSDYPEVVRELEMATWEVRRKLGFVPTTDRVQMLTGRGPSMRGMIEHGDVVFVDTAINFFDGDAVYVINVGGETQIKILQMRPDGLYVVSKNDDYPAFRVHADSGDFFIAGKVLCTLGMRTV